MESHRKLRSSSQTLLFIFALIGSNLLTYFSFCCPSSSVHGDRPHEDVAAAHDGGQPLSQLVAGLVTQLNITQSDLHRAQQELVDVKAEVRESRVELSHLFLDALTRNMELINASTQVMKGMRAMGSGSSSSKGVAKHGKMDQDPWAEWASWMRHDDDDNDDNKDTNMGTELQEFITVRPLPLGFNPGQDSHTLVSSIGHNCVLEEEDLKKLMDYEVGGECPNDQNLAQRLILHGCEPLPRRRCFARMPPNYIEPYPIPESLWTMPDDNSILWSAYTCKSFKCLNDRKKLKVLDDCNDCFDLNGKEKDRWERHGTELDFSIDEAIGFKNGTIRIGLDIGGGTASFAVRMRERKITIVTTSMNLNGPFNNFIALRGVVPLYITLAQRLPFFDNTLDIVHSMHVLSHWIPLETLEFLLFDIDRVLRPGGIFWLDHFFCGQTQLKEIYVPMINNLGYITHKWVTHPKVDRDRPEIYLSAVLEKPMRRHS